MAPAREQLNPRKSDFISESGNENYHTYALMLLVRPCDLARNRGKVARFGRGGAMARRDQVAGGGNGSKGVGNGSEGTAEVSCSPGGRV